MSDHQDPGIGRRWRVWRKLEIEWHTRQMFRNAKYQQSSSSEDVGQYLDRMVIEWFAPGRHKIVFEEISDEHSDIDVDEVLATNRIRARSVFK